MHARRLFAALAFLGLATGIGCGSSADDTEVTTPAPDLANTPGGNGSSSGGTMSTFLINGAECAAAPAAEKRFTDLVISVP